MGHLPCSPGTVNVGVQNTVDASEAHGGALPYLSTMGVDGAHNTVDAQRHVGGALPCLSGMGVDGAHNTVGKMSAPTTLLGFCHAKEVVEYCPTGV